MLLPYLEQTQVYNAINFAWAPPVQWPQYRRHLGQHHLYNLRIAAFLCPSDGEAGTSESTVTTASRRHELQRLDSEHGCSHLLPDRLRPAHRHRRHVEHGGVLRGDCRRQREQGQQHDPALGRERHRPRRHHLAGQCVHQPAARDVRLARPATRPGASSGPPAVTTTLSTAATAGAGERPGIRMFNTVVPPSSEQYPWSGCRFGCSGCNVDAAQFTNATQLPPRRGQRRHGRRLGPLRQGLDRDAGLVGARHPRGNEVISADSY